MSCHSQRKTPKDPLAAWGGAPSRSWLRYGGGNALLNKPAHHEDTRGFMAGGTMPFAMRDRWSEGFGTSRMGGLKRLNPQASPFVPSRGQKRTSILRQYTP
jgi:hypothetical protein